MPTMPQVVGLELQDAQAAMQAAGVLVLASIGYFGVWPITAQWGPRLPNVRPGTVTAQSPSSGATVAANAAVTLNLASFPMSVSYP